MGSDKVWSQMEMMAMNFRVDENSLMEMNLVEMNLSLLCPATTHQSLSVRVLCYFPGSSKRVRIQE